MQTVNCEDKDKAAQNKLKIEMIERIEKEKLRWETDKFEKNGGKIRE